MILYHGSYLEIPNPDLKHSRINVDFGVGFYTTPFYEQAGSWCRKFEKEYGVGFVSCYELEDIALEKLKVLQFPQYDDAWLEFVLRCRRKLDTSDYDIVIGGIANDRVFNTVELYFDGLIDRKEAIRRLQYEKPNLQVCLRTQIVLENYLHFKGSDRIC